MKINKGIYAIILAITLTACGYVKDVWNMDSNVRKIELGMSKKQVISIMGKYYEIVGARKTEYGNVETIRYSYSNANNIRTSYLLSFEDGKLVEWFQEKLPLPHSK